ncbi:hypothetical protein PMAYCL1PPCAC_19295, partial [Pristionchus mayeri]
LSKVNHANNKGQTALMLAAAEEHLATVKVLLEGGAGVCAVDRRGRRALQVAGAFSQQMIIDALLNGGAGSGLPRSLTELLVKMNLEKYEDKLREENVDSLNVFFDLNDQDLTDMKIPYGPKKRMLAVIDHYEKTKEINPFAVESNSPAVSRMDAPSSVQQQEIISTLRHIAQQNDACKRLAMTSFEHREDPAQLCQLLPQIINCCDQIATRLARHSTS